MGPLSNELTTPAGRWSDLKDSLPAGIVDAGFASLGTFVAGLAAVNLLSDVDRGVYAVFVAAFIVGTTFPHNLVYLPSQVYTVGRPIAERLEYLGRVISMGLGFSLLGSGAILIAAIATASHTSTAVTLALSVTAVLNLAVSTAQDNLRRMLHISELHWSAASMSIVQFTTVVIVLVGMMLADIPVVWIPFGSLFIANIVSSILGLIKAGGFGHWDTPPGLQPRVLVRSGRWLLGQALIPTGAAFLASVVITNLAGAEAMGYAESARVVAQPVLVFATGLTAVLGPKVMASAMSRDNSGASTMLRRFLQLTAGAGILYLAFAGWATPWNPMQVIVPSAYIVGGLVAVTIVANIAFAAMFLRIEELMGARREVDLVKVALFASPLLIAVGFTAGATGAFARPLGLLALTAASFPAFLHYRNKVYRKG
jgi:O-antigen/teichoic acid export membrane protein